MQIKNVKKNPNAQSILKCRFTLVIESELGMVEIDGAFFEKDSGQFWVNYCGREYTSKDGKKKVWNEARFPNMNFAELNKKVKALLQSMEMKPEESELPF
jgi:hypothetical protein